MKVKFSGTEKKDLLCRELFPQVSGLSNLLTQVNDNSKKDPDKAPDCQVTDTFH